MSPANPFQDGVSVQISGDSSGLDNALGSAQGSLLSFKKAVGLAGGALAALSGVAIAGAINEARKFEEQMVELEKVTDPETAAAMSEEIKNMAETIPLAQEELARIASDAGRFGIRGPKNIRNFTEAVSKMATATNLASQEAGEALAKLAQLTGTPIDEVENLGSAINELSNNFATSSQEIVDNMLRSSAAMSQFGLSQVEIAGFAATLNEVSESSERAGTRLRRLVQEIMNPKKVSDLSRALGLTVDEFKAMQKNDPAGLLRMMAQGMREGGDTADLLNETLSTTSRQALAGLGQNLDGLNQSLDMSEQAFRDNTSLQKEFDKATQTFNSRLKIFTNRLRNIAITIGNQLLPPATKFLNWMIKAVAAFEDLNQKSNGLFGALTLVAGVIGGLVIAVGSFVSMLGGLSAVMGGVSTAVGILGTAFTVLTGPIGLVLAAIVGLAAAWQTNFLGIRDTTLAIFNNVLKPAFRAFASVAEQTFKAIRDVINLYLTAIWKGIVLPIANSLNKVWQQHNTELKQEAQETWAAIRHAIDVLKRHIWPAIQLFISDVQTAWNRWGDEILTVAEFIFDQVLFVMETTLDAMLTALGIMLDLIQGDWREAWGKFQGFYERTLERILDFIRKWRLKEILMDAVDSAVDAIDRLKNDFRHSGERLIESFIDGLREEVDQVGDAAREVADEARKYLPLSDAEKGPLSELTASGEAFSETFAEGIEGNLRPVEGAAAVTAGAAAPRTQGGGSTTVTVSVDARGADDPQAVGTAVANELRSVLQR